eukprot:TRINITY_DN2454_c0_g1_i1.p1 TRINITY_DN2454_c0_g1~~TRINITY_DN2454_c0_g1_i1.p1  ORF type:complete len:261 (-),score=45.40 TRINITY_DN2454_c0_g1_i1:303-1085(-)
MDMEFFAANAQFRISASSFGDNGSFNAQPTAATATPGTGITPVQFHHHPLQTTHFQHSNPSLAAAAASTANVQSTLIHEDVDAMLMLAGSHENSAPMYFDFNSGPVSSAAQREFDNYLGLEVGSNSRHNSLLFEPVRKSMDEMDVSPSQYMGSPQILPPIASAHSTVHFHNHSASSSSTFNPPSSSSSGSVLSRNIIQRRGSSSDNQVSTAVPNQPNSTLMRLYEIDFPTGQEAGSFPKAGSYKEFQGLLDSELDMHLGR